MPPVVAVQLHPPCAVLVAKCSASIETMPSVLPLWVKAPAGGGGGGPQSAGQVAELSVASHTPLPHTGGGGGGEVPCRVLCAGPRPVGRKLGSVVRTSLSTMSPSSRIQRSTTCTPVVGMLIVVPGLSIVNRDHVHAGPKPVIRSALGTAAPSSPTWSESSATVRAMPRTHT